MSFLDADLYCPSIELDNKFQCSICFGIILDAVRIIPCNHSFCRPCLDNWIVTKTIKYSSLDDIDDDSIDKLFCPFCKQEFLEKNIFTNFTLMNQINHLSIFCPNSCKSVIFIKDLNPHFLVCPSHTISCSNFLCKVPIKRQDLTTHLETCQFSLFECKHGCGMFFSRTDLIKHYIDKQCLVKSGICSTCDLNITNESHDCVETLKRKINLLETENKILLQNLHSVLKDDN